MTTIQRACVNLTAAALVVAAIPLSARLSTTVQGVLLRMDMAHKTFTIETSIAKEMDFKYTDQTTVSGTQGGVAGLATTAGIDVTVQYIRQDIDNVATQIEVHPKNAVRLENAVRLACGPGCFE